MHRRRLAPAVGIILLLVLSCAVTPKTVYRLEPASDDTVWLQGQAYTHRSDGNIAVVASYDGSFRDGLIFDVEITNLTDMEMMIEPQYSYYYPVSSLDQEISERPYFAIDPETEILETDISISRQEAAHKSAMRTDSTLLLLDLFVDIATIGTEKSDEERIEEDLEDIEREERIQRETQRHEYRHQSLNELRAMWTFDALRKTTLGPSQTIQGQLHFPAAYATDYIQLHVVAGEYSVSIPFSVHRYLP